MCIFEVNYINSQICLHCGIGKAKYCEDCFQELIGQNAGLQLDKEIAERRAKGLKGIIDQRKKYIIELEYIRDCYYKEIQNRKMFKLDKEIQIPDYYAEMVVINNEILKRANKIELYEHEEYLLEDSREIPIIVYVNEKEYNKLKYLSETYENITYDTDSGIYIE